MTDAPETPAQKRRRWISIGETVAILGLIVSALALWNSWQRDDDKEQPPVVVERGPKAIPLALKGRVEDEGKLIRIAAVEPGHSLDQLTITANKPASGTAEFGSEPILSAAMVETWLPKNSNVKADGAALVTIETRYIEAGETRTATQRYRIAYRWTDGGLFGGHSLRLKGISRG